MNTSHISSSSDDEEQSPHHYRCTTCNKTYESRSGLAHHIQNEPQHNPLENEGILEIPGKEPQIIRVAIKRYRCNMCFTPISTIERLTTHMMLQHNIGERNKSDFRKPCDETVEHLLHCPHLENIRSDYKFAQVPDLALAKIYVHPTLAQYLCLLFGLPDPVKG